MNNILMYADGKEKRAKGKIEIYVQIYGGVDRNHQWKFLRMILEGE